VVTDTATRSVGSVRLTIGVLMAISPALGGRIAAQGTDSVPATTRYAAVARLLERFIGHEMADKGLPGLSIALVDDQTVVWAKGFGYANPRDSVRATAHTIYRVGSVSKLFTDIGIMQLVERGTLDLDAPVGRYLGDFHIQNPYGKAITLRELMSHRAGLVREPPVGNYFESAPRSLTETVRSLNRTKAVYEPESHAKYSNAGIAVVGYVLEQTQREPFARYLRRTVLEPMGLHESAFAPDSAIVRRLATGMMWTLDGRTFDAPTFQLGMAPAGSMYAPVTDLARFESVLFAGGKGPGGQVLRPETLAQMWTPQFAPAAARTGFGLGFALSALDGQRVVRHGGAIYGFATEVAALPDAKLGVVVATTKDAANAVTGRIADVALHAMSEVRAGKSPRPPVETRPISLQMAKRLDGRYGTGAKQVDLVARDSVVYLTRAAGGQRTTLKRWAGDTLVADDELAFGARARLVGAKLLLGTDTLDRVERPMPRELPGHWRALIGEYGWDHDVLYIHENDGRLYALIEWFFDYPLTEVSSNVFAFPASGLYDGERVVFTRSADGRATQAEAAGIVFPRRHIDGEDGKTFHITPLHPVDQLRAQALAASPPDEKGPFRPSDLVELVALDPSIKLDIRYASTNNFLQSPMYSQARAFMQRPAAEAVVRAHRALMKRGYGLLIHDAYRPWYVTKMFWDATPDSQHVFVADPSQGSRHNRGAAVDLTLYDLRTGRPIEMVGGYDEMSPRSYPDYQGGTALQRWHREVLRAAMEAEGFHVYQAEWWHFDYRDWRAYPIGTATFEKLGVSK
jgi:CubicO group peptidase (beta-lactamase class C family)/D-alanyl-D-alanine dipeptidase